MSKDAKTASEELLARCAALSEKAGKRPRANGLYRQALDMFQSAEKDATDLFRHYQTMVNMFDRQKGLPL